MKKKRKLEPFWIRVMTRNLSTCLAQEGFLDTKKDIHYVCGNYIGEDNGYDISQIIYKIIKQYKELQKDGGDYELIVTTHHDDDYNYDDDGNRVERTDK